MSSPRVLEAMIGLLLCLVLQGCALFGIPNAVREGQLGKPSVTQIVYGLDASRGGLSVALDWFDPATGKSGTCSQHDHTRASTPKGATGVSYFVFDVPPGAYVVGIFYTTFGSTHISVPTVAYRAPSGRQTYIGTFAAGGLDKPDRDLDRAKRDLGPDSADLELAEAFTPANLQRMTVCSP